MATIGPITSNPAPSVLFNPMAVDAALMQRDRNAMMMQAAQEDRGIARVDREREEVGRVSASLLALPAGSRPAAYSAALAGLQRQGMAMRAPPEYPGDEQIEVLARSALPAAKQFELAEKKRASDALMGMLGGIMGGDAGGLSPSGPPAGAAAPIPGAAPAGSASPPMTPGPGPMTPAQMEANRERVLSGEITPEQGSAERTTVRQIPGGYRANPGVAGQYAGLAPPTGTINPLDRAAIGMAALSGNPTAMAGAVGQVAQRGALAQERTIDNNFRERQFGVTQQNHAESMEIQRQNMARAEAAAKRAAEAEAERIRLAQEGGVRSEAAERRRDELERERVRLAQDAAKRQEEAAAAPKPAPVGIQGAMLENAASLRTVDNALERLHATGGAGIGARGYVPGAILNRMDPAGVQLRADIADIGSLKLHDRSGAAVSASESPRLMPFIPLTTDDPQTARRKLERFRSEYASALRDQYAIAGPQAGHRALPPIEEALSRPPPGPRQGGGQAAPQRLQFNPATGRIE